MTQPAHGWRSHYALLVLLFVYTMSYIDRQIMGILVEPIKQEFGVSDTAMGLLTGLAFALFYGVLAIPFGRYADRANRRNFVSYCCAAWSVMTALCGMATGFWTLTLARMGVAVGEAGGGAPSISMIADHYPPQQRGRAMSIYMLGPQLGILLGFGLGGWIAQHYGWRAAFLVMSVPGVLAAILLRFTTVEPQRGIWETAAGAAAPPATESLGLVLRDLWASRAFVRITLAVLLMVFAGTGIGIWTPAFLVRSHGMTLQGAGAAVGLHFFGALRTGFLHDASDRPLAAGKLCDATLNGLLCAVWLCHGMVDGPRLRRVGRAHRAVSPCHRHGRLRLGYHDSGRRLWPAGGGHSQRPAGAAIWQRSTALGARYRNGCKLPARDCRLHTGIKGLQPNPGIAGGRNLASSSQIFTLLRPQTVMVLWVRFSSMRKIRRSTAGFIALKVSPTNDSLRGTRFLEYGELPLLNIDKKHFLPKNSSCRRVVVTEADPCPSSAIV